MENLTRLMEEALALNDRAMTYMVSKRLAELFPGQSVLDVHGTFDAEGFARYGGADAKLITRLAHQELVWWDEDRSALRRMFTTSWIEIESGGHRFQVIKAPKYKCGYAYWVVGPAHVLDDFVRRVFAFSRERAPKSHVYAKWWSDAEALDREIEQSKWSDLVLPDELEAQLKMHTQGFFEAKEEFAMLGVPWKRGLLLTGPPGNGKTHLIRAILGSLPVPRVVVKSFGDDSDDVRDVFDKVRELAPCVLVLEDLDSLIKDTLLSTILNALDGTEPLNGVLVIATTNHPEKLDPAIRSRPSRFDRVIEFGPPALPERIKMLRRLFARGPREMRLRGRQIEGLARLCEGFSYAYLKELAISSTVVWSREKQPGSMFGIAKAMIAELRSQIASATAAASNGQDA